MSWGEVKKVNSDLNVPLDERMTWFDGYIPRLSLERSCSKSGVEYSGEILNITGRGYITSMYEGTNGTNSDSNYSASMTVYIDENTDERKVISLSGTGKVSDKRRISLDPSAASSDIDMSGSDINVGGQKTINGAIPFKESLRVVISQTLFMTSSLSYILI